MHDARLGRFFAVDPLAPEYPHNSPYAFSENRVIDAIELEGLEKLIYSDALPEAKAYIDVIQSNEVLNEVIYSKIADPFLDESIHIFFIGLPKENMSRPTARGQVTNVLDILAWDKAANEPVVPGMEDDEGLWFWEDQAKAYSEIIPALKQNLKDGVLSYVIAVNTDILKADKENGFLSTRYNFKS